MNNTLGNWAPFVSNGQPSTNSNTKNFTGGPWTFTETARTSGASQTFTITPGNSTGQTASTEIIGFDWNTFTRTWATGAITTQREVLFAAPTYAFAGASVITNAATLAISAAPIAGSNATITNAYALWVQAGKSLFGGAVTINDAGGGTETPLTVTASDATNSKFEVLNGSGTSSQFTSTIRGTSETTQTALSIIGLSPTGNDSGSNPMILIRGAINVSSQTTVRPLLHLQCGTATVWTAGVKGQVAIAPQASTSGATGAFLLTPGTDTSQTLSTEISSFRVATHTRTWATGALTTNREYLFEAPTYAFAGASTITNAATVAITAEPIAGTNATITNAYALWVQAGKSLFGASSSNFTTDWQAGVRGVSTGVSGSIAALMALNVPSPTGASSAINTGVWGGARSGSAQNLTSATGALAGLVASTDHVQTSTVTAATGLLVRAFTNSGGGTVTNTYGVYLSAQTVGTTNYGIYSLGAAVRNYFAGNVLLGTTSAGTDAAGGVLALSNGATAPSDSTDLAQLYAVDLSAGNCTLGIRTERAVVTEAVASDRTLSVVINGTTYRILLAA